MPGIARRGARRSRRGADGGWLMAHQRSPKTGGSRRDTGATPPRSPRQPAAGGSGATLAGSRSAPAPRPPPASRRASDPREAATRAARARSPAPPGSAPIAEPPPAARSSPPTPSRRAPARSSRRPSNWRATTFDLCPNEVRAFQRKFWIDICLPLSQSESSVKKMSNRFIYRPRNVRSRCLSDSPAETRLRLTDPNDLRYLDGVRAGEVSPRSPSRPCAASSPAARRRNRGIRVLVLHARSDRFPTPTRPVRR